MIANDSPTVLDAVFADYGPASLLRSGAVEADGFRLNFVDTGSPVQGMARMVRGLEFDVVDMSPTTFLTACSRGVPVVALPIAMFAEWPQTLLWTRIASNVHQPEDLAGKTVGVRTWLNPVTIWLRGLVADEFGVELNPANWLVTVADTLEFQLPANARRIESAPRDHKLLELLATGEIDAAVDAFGLRFQHTVDLKRVDPAAVQPLFPDTSAAADGWYRRFGFIPIMHMVVTKRETLERYPQAAAAIIDAFRRAKTGYLDALRSRKAVGAPNREPWLMARDDDNREFLDLGLDPLPEGNDVVKTLDQLAKYMVKFGCIDAPLDVRAHFAGL